MASFVQLVPVFLLAALVQEPVAAVELKCWTCTSDLLSFCRNELTYNATMQRFQQTCLAGEVCKTEITAIDGGSTMVSRGCATQCNNDTNPIFCHLCKSDNCNSGACDDKSCKKNGGVTLGASVAILVASSIVLCFK